MPPPPRSTRNDPLFPSTTHFRSPGNDRPGVRYALYYRRWHRVRPVISVGHAPKQFRNERFRIVRVGHDRRTLARFRIQDERRVVAFVRALVPAVAGLAFNAEIGTAAWRGRVLTGG